MHWKDWRGEKDVKTLTVAGPAPQFCFFVFPLLFGLFPSPSPVVWTPNCNQNNFKILTFTSYRLDSLEILSKKSLFWGQALFVYV